MSYPTWSPRPQSTKVCGRDDELGEGFPLPSALGRAQASPFVSPYELGQQGMSLARLDVKVAWGRGLHKVKTARPIAEPEFAKQTSAKV